MTVHNTMHLLASGWKSTHSIAFGNYTCCAKNFSLNLTNQLYVAVLDKNWTIFCRVFWVYPRVWHTLALSFIKGGAHTCFMCLVSKHMNIWYTYCKHTVHCTVLCAHWHTYTLYTALYCVLTNTLCARCALHCILCAHWHCERTVHCTVLCAHRHTAYTLYTAQYCVLTDTLHTHCTLHYIVCSLTLYTLYIALYTQSYLLEFVHVPHSDLHAIFL